MLGKFWDFLLESSMLFFIPLVCTYFSLTSNLFLNTACEEASGLEKLGNTLLIPCHYLFVGQTAKKEANGDWTFSDRFNYVNSRFVSKTIVASVAAVPSFISGVSIKLLSLLTEEARVHHQSMQNARNSQIIHPKNELYQSYGIDLRIEGFLTPEGYQRRPGDEQNMNIGKEGLKEIATLLGAAKIQWWVDCGTCLGAYRYGGVIPWDDDIDIAVLVTDFDNVYKILNQLDPNKYIVQDWSTRNFPKSYIKVYVRGSGRYIDVYHFAINPEAKTVQYILSQEYNFFYPKWVNEREKRFTAPVSFATVFPLKKALFDGIAVNVPNDTKSYLQRYYGENLAPAKIFDPKTQKYEKDLTHPYWQFPNVH